MRLPELADEIVEDLVSLSTRLNPGKPVMLNSDQMHVAFMGLGAYFRRHPERILGVVDALLARAGRWSQPVVANGAG